MRTALGGGLGGNGFTAGAGVRGRAQRSVPHGKLSPTVALKLALASHDIWNTRQNFLTPS